MIAPEGTDPGSGGGSGNHGGGTGDKTFTQAEVDRRVQQAVEKRDKEWQTKLDEAQNTHQKALEDAVNTRKEVETKLTEAQTAHQQRERELGLFKEASKQGVSDPEGTLAIVQSLGYEKEGKVDWEKVKMDRPYLFEATTGSGNGDATNTNAGSGKGSKSPQGGKSKDFMNQAIRERAGFTGNED